jgi:hypothetical protein
MRDNDFAILAICDALAPQSERPKVLERVTLGDRLGDLLALHSWRKSVTDLCAGKGYEVMAVSLIHGDAVGGAHILATVRQSGVARPGGGKTASIGGRPIDSVRRPARTAVAIRRRG